MDHVKKQILYINSKLRQLCCMKDVEQAQAFLTKSGLLGVPSVIAKLITFTSLSRAGSLAHGEAIFQETPMDNPFICNTMIRAYANSVFPIKALHVYNHMQVMNVELDNFTYNFILKACATKALWNDESDEKSYGHWVSFKGCEIHCRILKVGLDGDPHIQNSLVNLYSRCGLLVNARKVFDGMTERTIASWNVMIAAYDRINDYISADYLFKLMPQKNVVSWNTLLTRHVRLNDIELARKVFEEMTERDTVSWNSMIAGYIQVKDYVGALKLFGEMQNAGVDASEITLTSILGACAETGHLEAGKKIHKYLKEHGNRIEGYLGVALVDMYAKCGNLHYAREVFDKLKMKPVSCWNAMIAGLAIHGFSKQALELFESMEMRFHEVRPDRVTFIGVLIACSHKGLVEEGRRFFNRMINVYKITPDIKHYGCMVDLLSRWGLLDEAYLTIKTMPFEPNHILWTTLLGACKVHNNVDIAEESFKQLAKLVPPTDSDYVLLSNIYAEAKRWDDVERMRKEMVSMRLQKKPGFSHMVMQSSRMGIAT